MRATVKVTMNPALRVRTLQGMAVLDNQDMTTLRDRMDSKFKAHERALFATEGASGGSKWDALSKDYAEEKARKFAGRKILQRSGRLRRSLAEGGDEHVATYAVQPRPTVTLGTDVEVGAYHAPGSLHNPRMPVRDPLQHTPEQERSYLQIATDYFTKVKLPRVLRVLQAWGSTGKGA